MTEHTPIELSDDGLLSYERGPRAQRQIEIVRAYLSTLSEDLLQQGATRRMFVQLFSEPGLYRNRVTLEWFRGAALHALSLLGFNYYVYSSLNAQVLATLRRRYDTYFARPDREAYFLGGNCNDLARGVVAETELFRMTSRRPNPVNTTFCAYQGDVQIRWETVVAISRLPQVNLIFYYPMDALNRQMSIAYGQRAETVVDAFFGSKAWRDLYARSFGRARHDLLFPYFRERIMQLGFVETVSDLDLNLLSPATEEDPDLYRLLFVHKQPKDATFWTRLKQAVTSSNRGTEQRHK